MDTWLQMHTSRSHVDTNIPRAYVDRVNAGPVRSREPRCPFHREPLRFGVLVAFALCSVATVAGPAIALPPIVDPFPPELGSLPITPELLPNDEPCADPDGVADVLLVYPRTVGVMAVGGEADVVVEVVLTLDLDASNSSLGTTGTREIVTLPCRLSATLDTSAGSAGISPSGSRSVVLTVGSAARLSWDVGVATADPPSFVLSLSGSGGPTVSRSIDLQWVVLPPDGGNVVISIPGTLPAATTTTVLGGTSVASGTTVPAGPIAGSQAPGDTVAAGGPVGTLPATDCNEATGECDEETEGEGEGEGSPGDGDGPGAAGDPPPDESTAPSTEQTGSSSPTPDTASPVNRRATEQVAECARQLDQLLDATILYEPSSEMVVGETSVVKAVITLTKNPDVGEVFGSSTGPVAVEAIIVSCQVEAALKYVESDFEVDLGSEFRPWTLTSEQDASWTWNVKPKRVGRTFLTLTIRNRASDGSTTPAKDISKTIQVLALPDGTSSSSGLPVVPVLLVILLVGGAAAAGWQVRRRRRVPHTVLPFAGPVVIRDSSLFVSYSRKDSSVTKQIVSDLEAAGYQVWRDTDDIRGGESWRRSIVEGLRGAEVVIVLVSPNSVASVNVERELALAQDNGKPILPVSIKPAAVTDGFQYLLAGMQIVDTAGMSRSQRLQVVLQELSALSPRSPSPAGGPAPLAPPSGGPLAPPPAPPAG